MLLNDLSKCTADKMYPFHMPGHKRNRLFDAGIFPLDIDLTEVYGTDNLHSPESIIRAAQEKAACLWGAKESFILVNGSTCGILASVFSAVKDGGTVLVDRGSHLSVFNAIELRRLKPCFLMPEYDSSTGIRAGITPKQVEQELKRTPDASACIITSPTYEGAVCDIEGIAGICHRNGIPLIVDSAHGAHLGFSEHFPASAVKCGADAVIMSLHKTLPALTQTALLHINGDIIQASLIKKYLSVFETSSPSYILMASADCCTDVLNAHAREMFDSYNKRLNRFYAETAHLSALSVPYADGSPFFDFDRGKIIIFCGNTNLSGYELQKILRENCKIETEMASQTYVLALSSVCDTDEGFSRLSKALCEIDKTLTYSCEVRSVPPLPLPLFAYTAHEASLMKAVPAKIIENENSVSGGTVYVYPPGIPILLPGEIITSQVINCINACVNSGGKITGEQCILI